jgi:predicted transcriptional regulator
MSHPYHRNAQELPLRSARIAVNVSVMMMNDQNSDETAVTPFRAWRSLVQLDLNGAARALGKSKRIIEYYDAGRRIPVDTRKLMQAIVELGGKGEIKPWPDTATGSRP